MDLAWYKSNQSWTMEITDSNRDKPHWRLTIAQQSWTIESSNNVASGCASINSLNSTSAFVRWLNCGFPRGLNCKFPQLMWSQIYYCGLVANNVVSVALNSVSTAFIVAVNSVSKSRWFQSWLISIDRDRYQHDDFANPSRQLPDLGSHSPAVS